MRWAAQEAIEAGAGVAVGAVWVDEAVWEATAADGMEESRAEARWTQPTFPN